MPPHGVTPRLLVGPFEFDPVDGELYRQGERVRLQEQPRLILVMLLEHPGEIVSREALRERLWKADTFVDFEHSLNTAIKKVRQALGDSAETPTYIETVARRGYRFIAPLSPEAAGPARASGRFRLAAWGMLGALVVAIGSLAIWWQRDREPSRVAGASKDAIAVLPLRV